MYFLKYSIYLYIFLTIHIQCLFATESQIFISTYKWYTNQRSARLLVSDSSRWRIGLLGVRVQESESESLDLKNRYRNRYRNRSISRTDIGIGIGTAQSPEPILESESVSLDLKNRYWNRYRNRSISRTDTGIGIGIIQILGLATLWLFLIFFLTSR